jgi:hypothetical protein
MTLDDLGLEGFNFILKNNGMASEATELANSVIERRAAGVDAEPWRNFPSP